MYNIKSRTRFYITIAFLLYTCTGISQNLNADSLRRSITIQADDTGKVLTLNHLVSQLIDSDVKLAMLYANQSLRLSEQLGYEKGKASALGSIGVLLMLDGEYNKSIEKHL